MEHLKTCKCHGTGFVGIYDRELNLTTIPCDGDKLKCKYCNSELQEIENESIEGFKRMRCINEKCKVIFKEKK